MCLGVLVVGVQSSALPVRLRQSFHVWPRVGEVDVRVGRWCGRDALTKMEVRPDKGHDAKHSGLKSLWT